MKLRIGRIIAGTMALAAATVVGTAGNASATETPSIDWDHVFSAPGVKVYIQEHGDIISVCDTAANGWPAKIDVWQVYHGNHRLKYEAKASRGKGTCVTHQASEGGPYNLGERSHSNDVVYMYIGGDGCACEFKYFVNDH